MFCNKLHNELVQTNSQQNDFVLNESYRSEVETGDRHLVTERKCIMFNGRKPVNKTKKTVSVTCNSYEDGATGMATVEG